MKKDLKKRLEKALTTLKEPGGSTIRSIIKVINKDGPILSLRKVLEALQEGINEGFLCMYNGRVKLKQQLKNSRFIDQNPERKVDKQGKDQPSRSVNTSDSDSAEDSYSFSDEDAEAFFDSKHKFTLNKTVHKDVGKGKQKQTGKRSGSTKGKKRGLLAKKGKKKGKNEPEKNSNRKNNLDLDRAECDSILEMTPNMPEKKYARPTAEKPDLKKQRGPRCTSMKKDIRMPSKVHLPFVLPSAPQKTNIFNDLLRRSPEPVNGPLFDSFLLTTDNFAFFNTYC